MDGVGDKRAINGTEEVERDNGGTNHVTTPHQSSCLLYHVAFFTPQAWRQVHSERKLGRKPLRKPMLGLTVKMFFLDLTEIG